MRKKRFHFTYFIFYINREVNKRSCSVNYCLNHSKSLIYNAERPIITIQHSTHLKKIKHSNKHVRLMLSSGYFVVIISSYIRFFFS